MTRLRFSIRDLLWLTALCAVLVAWWIDRGRLERKVENLERSLQTRQNQATMNAEYGIEILQPPTPPQDNSQPAGQSE